MFNDEVWKTFCCVLNIKVSKELLSPTFIIEVTKLSKFEEHKITGEKYEKIYSVLLNYEKVTRIFK